MHADVFVTQSLGPDTQVDYQESAKSPRKSKVFSAADHRLDHGIAKAVSDPDLDLVIRAWGHLPSDVRTMIVSVVSLTGNPK